MGDSATHSSDAPDPSNDFSHEDICDLPQSRGPELATSSREDEDFTSFAVSATLTGGTHKKGNDDGDNNITSGTNLTVIKQKEEIDVDSKNNYSKSASGCDIRTKNESTNMTMLTPTAPAVDESNVANDAEKKRHYRYVTPQDFELLKVIGMGAFGKVLQVKYKSSQQILAMKVISKRILNRKKSSSYIENIHAEKDILTKIRHPFIVNMHCSFQTKEKLFIIMDFLAGGELFLRLGREGIFLEPTARFYIAEIVLALEHLHARGILHRDLKPENILLGADGHLCLTDFGLAKDFGWDHNDSNKSSREDEKTLTICGTQEVSREYSSKRCLIYI